MRAEDGPTPSPLRIQFSNQFPKKLRTSFRFVFGPLANRPVISEACGPASVNGFVLPARRVTPSSLQQIEECEHGPAFLPDCACTLLRERPNRWWLTAGFLVFLSLLSFGTPPVLAQTAGGNGAVKEKQGNGVFGGIELGSQGIKRVAIEVDGQGTIVRTFGHNSKTQAPGGSKNIGLASALEDDGQGGKRFTTAGLGWAIETVTQLRGFPNHSQHQPRPHHRWNQQRTRRVGQGKSGRNGGAIEILKTEVVNSGLRNVYEISEADEAKYTFLEIVKDPEDRGIAFLIDVGGGNTKFATAAGPGTGAVFLRSEALVRSAHEGEGRQTAARPRGEPCDRSVSRTIAARFGEDSEDLHQRRLRVRMASFLDPIAAGNRPNELEKLSSEALHDFRETLIKAPSLNQIFDPKIADLQKQGASGGEELDPRKRDLRYQAIEGRRLATRRGGVQVPCKVRSQTGDRLFRRRRRSRLANALRGGKGRQSARTGHAHLALPTARKTAQEGEKTFRGSPDTWLPSNGLYAKTARVPLEQQLREIKGAVTHGFQSIVDKLGDLPARTDIQKLDQTLGQKLDRIATVLEKLPLRQTSR